MKCATCGEAIFQELNPAGLDERVYVHHGGITLCDEDAMVRNGVDPVDAANRWIDSARID